MDSHHQVFLLKLARFAIEARLGGKPQPLLLACELPDREIGGLFVSLHRGRRLRGCIGRMDGCKQSLPQLVESMGLAVLEDPRFADYPVTLVEIPHITIEISVLSPMWKVSDALEMQPGVHGVYVKNGYQSGCFLPQVASDMRWNREEFLTHLCRDKAGLGDNAWRDPQTEVYLFTSEIISERSR